MLRQVPGFTGTVDQANEDHRIPITLRYCSSQLGFRRISHLRSSKKSILFIISCKSSRSSSNNERADSDDDYIQAFVLLSETARHYQMLTRGFQDETIWQSSARKLFPFSAKGRDSRGDISSIGSGFLRQFQSPTIFLKSSCDGDYLLPIIVGEFAVKRLVDSATEEENWGCPNQYQFVGHLVEKLGYKVMMVRVTERVLNTYVARIIFCKPGENDIMSVDARPSDAINVANRCKAPIYVNKRIVLTDGIRISFGMGRALEAKLTYDVSLDSAADGPDLLAEELEIVQNMTLAIREERYEDAAMWRGKLMKLRDSRYGEL